MSNFNQNTKFQHRLPGVGKITIRKRKMPEQPGNQPRRPLARRPAPRPKGQGYLTMQDIARILYGRPKK